MNRLCSDCTRYMRQGPGGCALLRDADAGWAGDCPRYIQEYSHPDLSCHKCRWFNFVAKFCAFVDGQCRYEPHELTSMRSDQKRCKIAFQRFNSEDDPCPWKCQWYHWYESAYSDEWSECSRPQGPCQEYLDRLRVKLGSLICVAAPLAVSEPEKGETMPEIKTTTLALRDSLTEGSKMGLSQVAAHKIVEAVRVATGSSHPEFFNTELGRKAEPFLLATGLHYLCTVFPGTVPQSRNVARVCELVMTKEAADNVNQIVSALLPSLSGIAELGTSIEDVEK